MTKYNTKCFNQVKPLVLTDDASPEWTSIDIEFNATATPYIAGDLIMLANMPSGYKVLDWVLNCPDLDSGGSALAFSLGVGNGVNAVYPSTPAVVTTDIGTEVWATGLTAAATGIPARCASNAPNSGSLLARDIILKCTAAATTYTNSTNLTGQLLLLIQR